MDNAERLHFETVGEWPAWLEQHYAQKQSTYRSLDDERGMLWWSPRRKCSL
jgi:hypothetical protein